MTDTFVKRSSTADDVGQAASRSDQRGDRLVFIAIVAAHAVFNLLFGPMGDVSSGDFYSEIGAYLAFGVILMQPLLFAMWAALGPQPVFHRIPWSLLACVAVLFALAINGLGNSSGPAPLVQSTVINLVPFVLLTLILFLVRRITGWRISKHFTSEALKSSDKPQFGMKYLLGLTTAAAIVLATGRFLFEHATLAGDVPVWQQQAVIRSAAFMGLFLGMLIPTFAAPWMTLARCRPRIGTLVIVLAVSCALFWLSVSTMIRLEPSSGGFREIAIPMVLIQLGAAAAGLVSALVVRQRGFRFGRSSR